MKNTPMHIQRSTTKIKRPKAEAGEFAPGYFTALIREHNWPPGFVSQLQIDPRTKRYMTEFQILNRPQVGFDVVALGLPGAVHYEQPFPSMTR